MKSDDVSCYSDLGLIETSAHLSFSLIVCVFKIKNLAMKNIKKTEECQLFKIVCSTYSYNRKSLYSPFPGGTPLYKPYRYLPILVWNRVWFWREQRECLNVFIVSVRNE